MKKEEIHLYDLKRILLGQAPLEFLPEVLIRTLIIFIFLIVVVRWLGKRMSGQLTIMEMAVMLTLGATVSVAMQVPDRGIVLSMVVLLCTVVFHRGLGRLGFKSSRIEEATQGKLSLLVNDGVLVIEEMDHCRISRQQLFAQLRASGIYNLGQVKRVYLEANGLFSIFQTASPAPGLPVLPPNDQDMPEVKRKENLLACTNCGVVKDQNALNACVTCGCETWTAAIF